MNIRELRDPVHAHRRAPQKLQSSLSFPSPAGTKVSAPGTHDGPQTEVHGTDNPHGLASGVSFTKPYGRPVQFRTLVSTAGNNHVVIITSLKPPVLNIAPTTACFHHFTFTSRTFTFHKSVTPTRPDNPATTRKTVTRVPGPSRACFGADLHRVTNGHSHGLRNAQGSRLFMDRMHVCIPLSGRGFPTQSCASRLSYHAKKSQRSVHTRAGLSCRAGGPGHPRHSATFPPVFLYLSISRYSG